MLAAQARNTSAALGLSNKRQQQMLNRDEFVALLTGLHKGHMQTDFQFLGDHVIPLIALFRD
jgi:hypothetical protein